MMTPSKAEAIARGEDTFSTVHVEPINVNGRKPTFIAAAILGFIALIVIGVVLALVLTNRAQDKADQNAAERDRARQVACVYYNVDQLRLRIALKDSLIALVPEGTTLTPEQQGRVDRYNATVDARLTYRDCTPAGIAAYFAKAPVDPAGG